MEVQVTEATGGGDELRWYSDTSGLATARTARKNHDPEVRKSKTWLHTSTTLQVAMNDG